MPLYDCVTADISGKKSHVSRMAENDDELINSFSSHDVFLIKFCLAANNSKRKTKTYSKKTIIDFTDMFSALLSSGLNVQDSLQICSQSSSSVQIKNLSSSLLHEVMSGRSLSDSLSMYPSAFSPLYRGLAKLSEKTGSPGTVFNRISEYLHSEEEKRTKITNAVSYPIFVLCLAIVACLGLVTFLIPKMSDMLIALNVNASGQLLGKINRMYFVLILLIFLVVMFISFSFALSLFYRRSDSVKLKVDGLALKLPILGKYLSFQQTLDFAFAMETMSSVTYDLGECLRSSAGSMSNLRYKLAIQEVIAKIGKGMTLSQAFGTEKIFPDYLCTWIKIGEKSGDILSVFSQIGKYFKNATDNYSKKLLLWIEPLAIILAGGFILILIINFVLPIFTMYGMVL